MKAFFRRTNFFSYFGVQAKLASVFLVWFCLFLAVFGFIFVMNYQMASARTDGMSIHDQLLTRMLLIQQTKDLAFYYGLSACAYVLLVFAYLIVYSHRITGPIHKLNKLLLKSTHNREWPSPIKFRKNDAFTDLAKNFNSFIDIMKQESEQKSK